MHFLDLTLPTLPENLALDVALLLDAEDGGPELLRVWQWSRHAVVLGAGGKLGDDVHEDACRADGVEIARRSSGGARPLNFEGGTFINFGSTGVAGRHELTVAAGLRLQLSQHIHFGLAGEFNVLPNDDGRHLDEFRLTADVIFRY